MKIVKSFVIGMLAVLLVGGVVCLNSKDEKIDSSEVTPIIEHAVTESVELEMVTGEKVTDEVESLVEKDAVTKIKVLEKVELNSLEVSRVVLTPGEDPRCMVRVTFNLPNLMDGVEFLVVDKEGYEVARSVSETSEITVNEGQETLYVYKAEVSGLEAETDYNYVIKSSSDYSGLMTFRTLQEEHTEIAFFGDIQGYKLSQYERFEKVFETAKEKMPKMDLAYLAGDIVDNGGTYDQWQFLDTASGDTLQSNLFISTIGNHDVYGGPEIYTHTFNYPKNGPEGLEERCFYIDLPNGRIASIDTESYQVYEEQVEWLESVMSDVDGFRIILMHRSVYPMSYDEAYIRAFAPIFDHLQIDLVLSGHDHIYNRTTMNNKEKVALGQGTTYIVGGSGSGSKFYYNLNEGHRYWEDVVYDDDYPVYTLLDIKANEVHVSAYALIDGQSELVDFFSLPK